MSEIETNIYPIKNLGELSTKYRLVEISGLRPDQEEYFRNRQALENRLSFSLRKPVLIIERNGVPFVVVPEEVTAIPSEIPLVRTIVQLRPRDEKIDLDYTRRGPDDAIALRFLKFLINAPLWNDSRLWQPSSGRPFFERNGSVIERKILRYGGFNLRPVITPDSGIGLCVDIASTYVGADPISGNITRNDFVNYWKGKNCIYRFGQKWYEIHLSGLADRNVKEYKFIKDDKTWSLHDYLLDQSSRPLPSDLGNLPEDSAVVLYQDRRGNELAAPAKLCYLVYQTNSSEVARNHHQTILSPKDRSETTRSFVGKYLQNLRFGNTKLNISSNPFKIAKHTINFPDLKFGHGVVLSARGTKGAIQTNPNEIGDRKIRLLKDRTAGFFCSTQLDRQYLILPRSIFDTFGDQFLKELSKTVNEYFPQDDSYKPTLVPYDDRGAKTFTRQAIAIKEAAQLNCNQPGYALVMVHHSTDRRTREEDQLASMVVRELRQRFDIRSAVIHTEIPKRAYKENRGTDGKIFYQIVPDMQRKLNGYLRNVTISKILLTNQRWPFVLASPLHSDVTIGLDVKHNTAGLLVVGSQGGEIRSELHESRQQERLLAPQMQTYIGDILRHEAEVRGKALSSFVLHRDGRIFSSELEGIRKVIQKLKSNGHLTTDAKYAILEISKSSPAPLRLYNSNQENGNPFVINPMVGTTYTVSNREAYLCTTGGPFLRQGTAHPLHVVMVEGTLPFSDCIEDLYFLSTLTWTQPEGCTRYPITIKLNDRILSVEAGEYDSEAIEFAESPSSEENLEEEAI